MPHTFLTSGQRQALLADSPYLQYTCPALRGLSQTLFNGRTSDVEKARAAFFFVRDNIPHSFDIDADIVTARAPEVLAHATGICHAKANLLAALLRAQGIPTGFCFQRLTLARDASEGYCLHGYNALLLGERWVKVDARGNRRGVSAAFSLSTPVLAFDPCPDLGEISYRGIYDQPDLAVMELLQSVDTLDAVRRGLPDAPSGQPLFLD